MPTAHRLRWIDADGSGKKMLVMAPLIGMDSAAPDYKTPGVDLLLPRAGIQAGNRHATRSPG